MLDYIMLCYVKMIKTCFPTAARKCSYKSFAKALFLRQTSLSIHAANVCDCTTSYKLSVDKD